MRDVSPHGTSEQNPTTGTPNGNDLKINQHGFSPQQQAILIRDQLFATQMAVTTKMPGILDTQGFQCYIDQFMKEAGSPSDPVEQLMLLQINMAHFRIPQLHTESANASELSACQMYNAAATRLLAEFRKLTLSLQAYRESNLRRELLTSKSIE